MTMLPRSIGHETNLLRRPRPRPRNLPHAVELRRTAMRAPPGATSSLSIHREPTARPAPRSLRLHFDFVGPPPDSAIASDGRKPARHTPPRPRRLTPGELHPGATLLRRSATPVRRKRTSPPHPPSGRPTFAASGLHSSSNRLQSTATVLRQAPPYMPPFCPTELSAPPVATEYRHLHPAGATTGAPLHVGPFARESASARPLQHRAAPPANYEPPSTPALSRASPPTPSSCPTTTLAPTSPQLISAPLPRTTVAPSPSTPHVAARHLTPDKNLAASAYRQLCAHNLRRLDTANHRAAPRSATTPSTTPAPMCPSPYAALTCDVFHLCSSVGGDWVLLYWVVC